MDLRHPYSQKEGGSGIPAAFSRLREKSTVNTSEEGAAMPFFRNLNPWRTTGPIHTFGDCVLATPSF